MPRTRTFEGAQVTIDDRYFPLLITVWKGRATLDAAKWALEFQASLAERGERVDA